MLKTRCNKCGKEIDRKKEYFVVLLHKEKMIDNEIEVLNNEELEMFCCEGCLGGK